MREWVAYVFLAACLLINSAAEPAPIWPLQRAQQYEAYRLVITVTHKETKQYATLAYDELFESEEIAKRMIPVAKAMTVIWLRDLAGIDPNSVDIEIKVARASDPIKDERRA